MRKILILTAAILLVACNTQKISEKKDINSQISTEFKKDVDYRKDNHVQAKGTTKVDSAMLAQINYLYQRVIDLESEVIRFDTSKPVDSVTGQPPVQEIIKIRSREASEVDYKSITEKLSSLTSEIDYMKSEIQGYTARLDSLSSVKEKTFSKTTNQPANKMRFLIIGIVIGLLMPGIIWLIRKLK